MFALMTLLKEYSAESYTGLWKRIRTGVVKMLENSKKVCCTTCKQTFDALADVEQYNQVPMPTKCRAKNNVRPCNGTKFQMVETPPGKKKSEFLGAASIV